MNQIQNSSFQGVWTAVVTPFLDSGEIDWPAFEALLIRQEKAGICGLVICGTTGESPTLAVQEKLALIRKARALLGSGVRVMAGTGDNNTAQSVELSKLAEDAGADSLLVVTPPYNKPTTNGLINHYETIARSVKLPICLYHVPGRTAQMLTVEQIIKLCKIDSIKVVKEASADIGFFSRCLNSSDSEFLTGDDPTFLASLATGGAGVISVVSNIFPEAMVDLHNSFKDGDHQRALRLHQALLPMIDALFCEANPGPTKAVFKAEGHCSDYVRPPLASMEAHNLKYLKGTLKDTKELLERI